ncbi:MAG: hypothetical protein JJ975_17550 [Bacteroidia bacterium]|nr:hypothetical protein [Bacteroidia bacterium]
MNEGFPYRSVHHYLDELFKATSQLPTDEQIRKAKQVYWKLYNKHHKAKRRRQLKFVTLSFSQGDYQKLQRQAFLHGEQFHHFLKQKLLSKNEIVPSKMLAELHQQTFLALEQLGAFTSDNNLVQFVIHLNRIEEIAHHLRKLNQVS